MEMKPKVIDIFSFNGEIDMLELRLKMLDEFVDQFIIVEAPSTFGQMQKDLMFESQKERISQYLHKIKYHITNEDYTEQEKQQALSSKYTNGEMRWAWEFAQKESIKKAMTHLNDEDICYIGDVDELWVPRDYNGIEKLKLRVYTYYLNMTSSEEFWGPIRCKYKDVKDACLNDIRNDITLRTEDYQGWHFTNMGGLEAVKKKVIDSYDNQLFNKEFINSPKIAERFGVADYIGRDFKLEVDESNWPLHLKNNRQHYKDMLK